MTRSTDDLNTADTAPDRLLQRYREANALDDARPAPDLRDAVLAQARAQAAKDAPRTPVRHQRTAAANDRSWTLRALGTLAGLGLVGLLVLQFDQGTPDEREVAFGAPPSPSTPSANRTPAPEAAPAPASADIATGPSAVESPPVPRAPEAEAEAEERPEAAQKRSVPAAPRKPESALKPTPDTNARAVSPNGMQAPSLERRAPESSAARSGAATPPMTSQAPPAASAEAQKLGSQAAPEALPVPALLRAAQLGDLAGAREAIARGDDLNAADANGRTVLMTAAARGDLALVRVLLDAGADTARTDQDGLTAADLARQAGHHQVLDLL